MADQLPPGMDPSMIPIATPPPGVLPNFENPETRAPTAIGVIVLFTILMFLFVCVRIPSNVMRYLIYFGILFTFVFYVIYLFLYIFLCPNTGKDQTCAKDLKTMALATSAVNVFDDFYILLIPMSAVSSLQLPPRRKLGLLAIFFTGFLACLCSIVSLVLRVHLNRGHDDVWNVVPVIVVGTIEFNIGIICSCLPTLPALFRRSSFFSRKTANKTSYDMPDSGNSGGAVRCGGAVEGGSKRGFGRLGDVGESKDSVLGLEAAKREGTVGTEDEDGSRAFEMGGFRGDEEDGRRKEWIRNARM
ncbi:MAG: hypothetical protein Q9219_006555 [cf. Caloplaca sp. 3 TL-2023]